MTFEFMGVVLQRQPGRDAFPDLVTEIYESSSRGDNPALEDARSWARDFFIADAFESDREALGLKRLARIVQAYKNSSSDYPKSYVVVCIFTNVLYF